MGLLPFRAKQDLLDCKGVGQNRADGFRDFRLSLLLVNPSPGPVFIHFPCLLEEQVHDFRAHDFAVAGVHRLSVLLQPEEWLPQGLGPIPVLFALRLLSYRLTLLTGTPRTLLSTNGRRRGTSLGLLYQTLALC